jgi:hypothetical protein
VGSGSCRWEQLTSDELVANRVRFDINTHGEPAASSAWATVGRSPEIKIDEIYKVRNSPASADSRAFYTTLIIGLLAATCGGGWFILHASAPRSDLASASASTENRHPDPNSVSPSLEQSSNAPSDRNAGSPTFVQSSNLSSDPIADTQKGGRLQTHDTIVRDTGGDAIAQMLQSSPAPLSSPISNHSKEQRSGARAEEPRVQTKLTAMPETRPTTIPGWMLREVSNGTAVLEGPNGIWRATAGQNVPGVGRVDSIVRWGNRWIVSTSKGLISTP